MLETTHNCKRIFEMDSNEKQELLGDRLNHLTRIHYKNCPEYAMILDALRINPEKADYACVDIPFLPASLFKKIDLKSISPTDIYKVLTSSGTSGTASRVYLDKKAAASQQQALIATFTAFGGFSRMPLLIVDTPAILKDRNAFSARGAGILGFSLLGTERIYGLDENMNLNLEAIYAFLERHKDERFLIFGFTYMVWQYLCNALGALDERIDLSRGMLFHGGGWKKLASQSISPDQFKDELASVSGLRDVHNYYGMIEQIGTIYIECEYGHLHCPAFADVIIRNPATFEPCGLGVEGIIQVLSALPESYPGHSILTDDWGVIIGEDDCACGRKGKYFKVHGRLKQAEIRGCSDV